MLNVSAQEISGPKQWRRQWLAWIARPKPTMGASDRLAGDVDGSGSPVAGCPDPGELGLEQGRTRVWSAPDRRPAEIGVVDQLRRRRRHAISDWERGGQ